jgi:hypothetical protein
MVGAKIFAVFSEVTHQYCADKISSHHHSPQFLYIAGKIIF